MLFKKVFLESERGEFVASAYSRGYAHRSGASCGTEPAKEFDGRARRAVTKAPARAAQTAAVL